MGRTQPVLRHSTAEHTMAGQPRRPSYACGLGPAGCLCGAGMAHATVGATLFLDYDNACWWAKWLSGATLTATLDPWVLGETICVAYATTESQVRSFNLRLVDVRVYVRIPDHREPVERDTRRKQVKRWREMYGAQVQVVQRPTDPPRRDGDTRVVVKELHTQLSVDLLTWAREVSQGESDSRIALLFSADRDCQPVVRQVATRFWEEAFPQIVLTGWLSTDESSSECATVLDIDDLPDRPLFLPWQAYQDAEDEARRRRNSLRRRRRRHAQNPTNEASSRRRRRRVATNSHGEGR